MGQIVLLNIRKHQPQRETLPPLMPLSRKIVSFRDFIDELALIGFEIGFPSVRTAEIIREIGFDLQILFFRATCARPRMNA
jgi:hypothetical protein